MKKILGVLLLLVVLALAATFFLPGLMERSAALWLRHHASRSGVTLTFDRIEAPLLRPVVIHHLRIVRPSRSGTPNLEISAPLLELKFNFARALGWTKGGHAVRFLRAHNLAIALRGRAANPSPFDWNALGWLLPDEFDLAADRILLEQPSLHIELNNSQLNGASTHAGTLTIASADFRAPLFRQNFADVRGITRWQDDRLVIAGTRLRDGLLLDSVSLDFTRLNDERLATEISATIFGGTARMNLATEKGETTRLWEGAASLTGISLAQLSSALGATEDIAGTIHASKFTFHGDPRNFMHATASIWTELTGFRWRERNADVVMLGANFYDRTIQLQELYLKQRANEFTLSGETTLGADWSRPDFHGEISGAINDLGQFAELFGRSANDFRGKLAVRGHVHTYERRVDGEVALTGDGLTLFRVPVDLLTARIAIDALKVQLAQLELKRGADFLHAQGEMDLTNNRSFTFNANAECHEVADYNVTLPLLGKLTGNFVGSLNSEGNSSQSKSQIGFTNEGLVTEAGATWIGDKVVVENLSLKSGDALCALTGEVNLENRHHVTAMFSSSQPLHADFSPDHCVRGLRFASIENGEAFTRIEFDGRQMKFDGRPGGQLCPAAEAGTPLTLAPTP